MNTYKLSARVFGIFFLLAYIAYIIGNVLVQSIVTSPDVLSHVYLHKNQVIIGVIFMSIVETFFNMGFAVIIFTILKQYNKNMAYGFFSAAIIATLMLIIGSIYLLSPVPLSDEYVKAGIINTSYFQTLSIICNKGNYFSYQISMAIWGLGGLMLSYLLYLSKQRRGQGF